MKTIITRVLAIMLGLLLFAPVSTQLATGAVTLRPATISVSPATYVVGGTVTITADFPTATYDGLAYGNSPVVTLYSDLGGTFQPVPGQTGKTSSSGGVYAFSYTVTAPQKVKVMNDPGTYAGGGQVTTPELTLTPQAPGSVVLKQGTISVSPSSYYTGDTLSVKVDFPTSSPYGASPILTLYQDLNNGKGFVPVAGAQSKTSSSSGVYTFTMIVTQAQSIKVMNDKSASYIGGLQVTTPVVQLTPKLRQTGELFMSRIGATTGVQVTGKLSPGIAGQPVALQNLSGSTWKQVGATMASDADGNVTMDATLSLLGLTSQYTARQYRLVGAASGAYVQVTSPTIKFMAGPTQLGTNVMRIRTAKNVYPSTKGVEIPGSVVIEKGAVVGSPLPLDYIDLRGSSTAGYDKKPYKLKFASNVKPFDGLSEGKRFNLLAMFLDNALVRDKMGLDLGRKLVPNLPWTPGGVYTEVFVNDLYVGAYLLTDSAKITDNAVKYPQRQRITVPDVKKGALLEVDGNSVSSSKFGFKTSNGVVVVFEDPDERKYTKLGEVDQEGYTDEKKTAVQAKVVALEKVLYGSKSTGFLAKVEELMDVDAAIDYYLVKEFTKDNDADFYRSHYFSIKDVFVDPTTDPNGRITFGPVWDFDRSAGIISDTSSAAKAVSSSSGWYLRPSSVYGSTHLTHNTNWFVQLTKSSEFIDRLRARWGVVDDKFEAVGVTDVYTAKSLLGVAATNDWDRWKSVTKRYALRAGNIAGEMEYVADWYRDRFTWMNTNIDK